MVHCLIKKTLLIIRPIRCGTKEHKDSSHAHDPLQTLRHVPLRFTWG